MKNENNDGRRKLRVEREVQQVISQFIITQLKNDLPGLVTVTRIQMPADFRAAQVFVTYYDPNSEKKNVIGILQHWSKDIQDEIAHVLKMRYCPKITFHLDETTGRILKIEKILSNISAGQSVDDIEDLEDIDED